MERFVGPYYARKDMLHDLAHVRRFLKSAKSLSAKYHADNEVLTYAGYFHGVDLSSHWGDLSNFLEAQGFPKRKATKILRVAFESHKESEPRTVEGKILHDAYLVEGGKTFLVVKSMVSGIVRGSSLGRIIRYFNEMVDGRYRCYLPEARRIYSRKEKFAREFFRNLKKNL